MNRLHAVQFLIAGMFLLGCRGPAVAFRDMEPAPTASVAGNILTVHIGVITNIPVSEVWVHPKGKVEDHVVYVSGFQRLYREQSREFRIRLPASLRSQLVTVVWHDPDGSQVSVPVTR